MPTGYMKRLAKEEENVNDYFAYATAIFKSLMGESKGHCTKNKTTEQRLKRP